MAWVLSLFIIGTGLVAIGCSEQFDPTKVPPPVVFTTHAYEQDRYILIVKQVQESLHARGYNPDWPSGEFGEDTISSLREFQEREGLAVTGQINQETLKSLGIEIDTRPRELIYSE